MPQTGTFSIFFRPKRGSEQPQDLITCFCKHERKQPENKGKMGFLNALKW